MNVIKYNQLFFGNQKITKILCDIVEVHLNKKGYWYGNSYKIIQTPSNPKMWKPSFFSDTVHHFQIMHYETCVVFLKNLPVQVQVKNIEKSVIYNWTTADRIKAGLFLKQ